MMRSQRLRLAALAVATALLAPAAALAAARTTEPGKNVLVYFVYTNQRLQYAIYREGPNGVNDLFLEKYVVRGDFATFTVINRSSKTHSFAFMKKRFTLKPGRKARFSTSLLLRGAFPYSSPGEPGKAWNGVFPVY